ncbi:MAG TPA: family 1 glycosylhydrolase [Prolixibacteraceae bacterium]|nr:family 1 glycosylhydrolase [Prolixibacteraceae bacterium]
MNNLENNNKDIDNIAVWGGAEYSVVRVNNTLYDQLAQSGHEERLDDLDLFSELNIKTIRYPLLWEKYAGNEKNFFKLHDQRLNRLQELGIRPIASLLHHGSGPFFTDLYDHNFPMLLAEFAYTIADRYPWIELYTPVNEPLTTARFSGLYGIWFPHKRDDYSFSRIFLNELKGVILSMEAVKSVNANAKLIQTEDIARIYSTPSLKYQADFENQRRWLTYDILSGHFNPKHPLWKNFIDSGISVQTLDFFTKNHHKPSICGFNYYVTSERYLDERKSVYPPCFHGGNGFHEYADVEAVRANIPVALNVGELLCEAWDRYQLPLALTEVHMACTREEQLRWFHETYQSCLKLKKEGVDFRALTAWSYFGSYDWNSLLCTKNNDYESGVFDIRSGKPRATALAGMIKSINNGQPYKNNLLDIPGWWRRKDRLIYKPDDEMLCVPNAVADKAEPAAPILIVGATGSLGSAFAKICNARGIHYYLSERGQLDIACNVSIRKTLEAIKPWAVINAAGFARIDEAEVSTETCFRENTAGPVQLAEICKSMGIKFVTFSTDQVFNGEKRKPYSVNDRTQPLNFYGLSKKLAEEQIGNLNPESLIIRSSCFFNPWHPNDRLRMILRSGLNCDRQIFLPSDIIMSPAYIPDIVNTVLDLLIDGESGIWHLSNQEEITLYDFARLALEIAGLNDTIVSAVPSSMLDYAALRPSYSVLESSGGITLPLLNNALTNFVHEFYKEPSFQVINQSTL